MAASLLNNFTPKELTLDMGTNVDSTNFESTEVDIPIIDFSLLKSGTPDQRSQIVRDIGKACEVWGCFSIINHGVPESLRTSMVEAFAEFFTLPEEERKEFMGKKTVDPIRHGTGIATTKSGNQHWRDFVRIFVHPTLHAPAQPPNFRGIVKEYARETREIAIDLLTAIGDSLGLEEGYMKKALDIENGHQILVGNHYPAREEMDLKIGLTPHSDTPLLSVVMQNGSIHGLEVMHNDKYVPVKVIPGSFFIHTGDLLEIVSNGIYKSLLHRALLDGKSTRMSLVAAFGVPLDKIVSPAPELVQNANKSMYPSMTYMDFVNLVKTNPFDKAIINLVKA